MATQTEIVEEMFEAALVLKPEERAVFLEQVCDGDTEVRQAVEALLVEDANAGSLLEHPPFALLTQAMMSPGETITATEGFLIPSPGRFEPGQVLLDRFVIVRFIAKGGMGEVYEAKDSFLQ